MKVLKVSRNTGFGMTRSFSPSRSSPLVMGRLLLVTLRKPRSKKPSTTTPLSASARMYGNVACVSADVEVRGTAPGMLVTQ